MFSFFKKFVPERSYLGVDIGTTSIKVVELTKKKEVPFLRTYGLLESYGHLDRPNSAIQSSSLKLLDNETANLLRLVVKHCGARADTAIASLPTFSAFTTLLEMPVMSQADTASSMIFQAKQYIPMAVSEVTVDWIKIAEKKNEEGNPIQQVLLVSVPNDIIEKYKKIFRTAGLTLASLEIEGLSSARILTQGEEENVLIVDIGSRSTAIFIAQNGLMKYAGQTDFAGGSLTQTVSAGLNIRVRRAEDLKKRSGLRGTGGEYELSTLMLPILDVIISEAKSVVDNFRTNYREEVSKVILSGGGANLLGIENYFNEQMKLPVTKASPFVKVNYPPETEPIVKELGPPFTVALGLGIKEL